jgi:hypothetical protein
MIRAGPSPTGYASRFRFCGIPNDEIRDLEYMRKYGNGCGCLFR